MPPVDALADLGVSDLLAALDTCPALVAITIGPDHLLAFQNIESARLTGRRTLGQPFAVAFPEATADNMAALDRVLSTREPYEQEPPTVELLGSSTGELHLHFAYAPLGQGPDGQALGIMLTAVDDTDGAIAQEAALRAALLVDISTAMNEASDPDEALQVLCQALVPAVADVAAVYVVPRTDSRLDVITSTGERLPDDRNVTPNAIVVNPALVARVGHPPVESRRDTPSPHAAVLAAGRPVVVDVSQTTAVSDSDGATDSATDTATDNAAWMKAAGAHSMVLLPLVVAGDLEGAVVLLATQGRQPYLATDLNFLELAVTRASTSVTHLRSVRDQRDIALELQRALLPAVPAQLQGASVAARYVAGSKGVEIGGDWWDVLQLGSGRIGIGVGDVAGRGVAAAVIMGQARAAMRAASLAELAPSRVLALLDTQLADVLSVEGQDDAPSPPRFATSVYAVIDPDTERLWVSNAGHPPLLVRRPDGTTSSVEAAPGPPLGLGLGGYHDVAVPFPRGSLLAAYTDGLVESRTRPVDTGVEMLCGHLSDVDPQDDLETAVDVLLKLMDRGSGHDDDVALVLVRTHSS